VGFGSKYPRRRPVERAIVGKGVEVLIAVRIGSQYGQPGVANRGDHGGPDRRSAPTSTWNKLPADARTAFPLYGSTVSTRENHHVRAGGVGRTQKPIRRLPGSRIPTSTATNRGRRVSASLSDTSRCRQNRHQTLRRHGFGDRGQTIVGHDRHRGAFGPDRVDERRMPVVRIDRREQLYDAAGPAHGLPYRLRPFGQKQRGRVAVPAALQAFGQPTTPGRPLCERTCPGLHANESGGLSRRAADALGLHGRAGDLD